MRRWNVFNCLPNSRNSLSYTGLDGVALGGLSVDISQQGQGVGTKAMNLLGAFAPRHFRQAKHVLLVVNQRNPGAKRVYEKSGFQVTGERLGGKGPQWIMTLPL